MLKSVKVHHANQNHRTFVHMKMLGPRKKGFLLLIVVMTAALLGLAVLQYYWMARSYQLQSQLFDETVSRVLDEVVRKAEKAEAVNLIVDRVEAKSLKMLKKQVFAKQPKLGEHKRIHLEMNNNTIHLDSTDGKLETFSITIDSSGVKGAKIVIKGGAKEGKGSTSKVILFNEWAEKKEVGTKKDKHTTQMKVVKQFFDTIQTKNQQVAVFEDLASELKRSQRTLKERTDTAVIDSLLKASLMDHGIDLSFNYVITDIKKDSVIFKNVAVLPEDVSPYKALLFPADYLQQQGMITLYFPDKGRFIRAKMLFVAGTSGVLMLVIISCFSLTIMTVLKQKKLSELKTDFINNMTHEFKTPVATIMLASEALKDEGIAKDDKRVQHLAGVIYDENQRLGNHVERVLNSATLENEQFTITKQSVDINSLIKEAAASMELQFARKGATVSIELQGQNCYVLGDSFHLAHVLFNLLDNANKYGGTAPQIKVCTAIAARHLSIRISDKGIGMTANEQQRIFEQFYRVPTGNLHDVKGFGLGLSYVQHIIKLHGGTIKVQSEKGMGTTFEINLPIA